MTRTRKQPKDYLRAPYSRVVIPDEETGSYTARMLEFPGCVTQGDSVQDAYELLDDAAEAWIEAALELNQEIPPPAEERSYSGRVLVRLPKSVHRRAAEFAEQEGTSLNQFIVAAVAERIGMSGASSEVQASARHRRRS